MRDTRQIMFPKIYRKQNFNNVSLTSSKTHKLQKAFNKVSVDVRMSRLAAIMSTVEIPISSTKVNIATKYIHTHRTP